MMRKSFIRLIPVVLLLVCVFSPETTGAQGTTEITLKGTITASNSPARACVVCAPSSTSGRITLILDYKKGSVEVDFSLSGEESVTGTLCDKNGNPTNARGTLRGQTSLSGRFTGSFTSKVDPQSGAISGSLSAKGKMKGTSATSWVSGCPGCSADSGPVDKEVEVTGMVQGDGSASGQITWSPGICKGGASWKASGTPWEPRTCDTLCREKHGPNGIGLFGSTYSNCACDCKLPFKLDKQTDTCRLDKNLGATELIEMLKQRGYEKSFCPKEGNLPPGSVRFWKFPGQAVAHTSIVLNGTRQIQMDWKTWQSYTDPHGQDRHELLSSIADSDADVKPADPKVFPNANPNKAERYEEDTDLRLCPPKGTRFDSQRVEDEWNNVDREFNSQTGGQWNCYGFVARIAAEYAKTGIDILPGSRYSWEDGGIVWKAGEGAFGNKEVPVLIGIAGFRAQITAESQYTIAVLENQSTIIRVFEGKVKYQAPSHSISIPAGQMVTINSSGVPSALAPFDINQVVKWWEVPATGDQLPMPTRVPPSAFSVPTVPPVPAPTALPIPAPTLAPAPAPTALLPAPVPTAAPPGAAPAPTALLPIIPGPAVPQVPSNIAILSGLAIAGAMLLILAGGIVAIIAAVSTRARPSVAPPPTAPEAVTQKTAARLDIARGSANVSALNLARQGATIGRDASNALVLHDVSVSRQHARIAFENGIWVIYDLNSSNGTFVNRARVTRQSLHDGDQIQIGQTVIVFRQ